jgi:ABC-type uncharacterized transport system substrate-binding protein
METPSVRLCQDCQSSLQGRTDKKFCDDHCRSNYNNRTRVENNSIIRAINLILKRNRAILERFNPHGQIKIKSIKLIAAGFDPNYHTHISYTKQGNLYIFCYEQGYQKIGSNEFLLVRENLE